MLLKSLLGIRITQLLLALVFLVAVSWVLYLVRSSPITQSQPTHIFTTTLRFLLPIATIPYTGYEIFRSFAILRNRNQFALAVKSRAFKVGRVLFEFGLGGLWFLAFIFSLGASSWSLTGDNGTGVGSSTYSSTNSTTPLTDSSATVIPPSATSGTSTLIVPPGGKVPMVLGSLMWIGLVGLFAMSGVGVVIETIRNWRDGKAMAAAPGKAGEA